MTTESLPITDGSGAGTPTTPPGAEPTAGAGPLPPLPTIDPADGRTWTFARTVLGHVLIRTSWSPVRFAPAYGLPGPHAHYQTLLTRQTPEDPFAYVGEQTYLTLREAWAAHCRICARVDAGEAWDGR